MFVKFLLSIKIKFFPVVSPSFTTSLAFIVSLFSPCNFETKFTSWLVVRITSVPVISPVFEKFFKSFISILFEAIFPVFAKSVSFNFISLFETISPEFFNSLLFASILFNALIFFVLVNLFVVRTILFKASKSPVFSTVFTLATILSTLINELFPLFFNSFPIIFRFPVSIVFSFITEPLVVIFLAWTIPLFSIAPELISSLTKIFFVFLISFATNDELVKIFPLLVRLSILIFSLTLISPLLIVFFPVNVKFVEILPVFNISEKTLILFSTSISLVFFRLPAISNFPSVVTNPSFVKFPTAIFSLANNFVVVFVSLAVKLPPVTISPVFSASPVIFIFPLAWISLVLFNFPFILSVELVPTTPEFSKFLTEISLTATNLFVVFTLSAVNFELVTISPVLFTLLAFISFNVAIFPVFIKSLVSKNSFVYILDKFSTLPFNTISFSAWVLSPASFISWASILILSCDSPELVCSYSLALIFIPFPWTFLTFTLPSAVISKFCFNAKIPPILSREFLSVRWILIWLAYILPAPIISPLITKVPPFLSLFLICSSISKVCSPVTKSNFSPATNLPCISSNLDNIWDLSVLLKSKPLSPIRIFPFSTSKSLTLPSTKFTFPVVAVKFLILIVPAPFK